MAVTKQVYTLSPTWTASGLADLFRSAFIDAGLMTEWYDSFLSGSVENRILEVVNDGTKTYGTVYYWFMFTTNTVGVHTALDWDATGHVPAGTVYLDYFSTTTNSTTNHDIFASTLATGTSLTLTRYTSAINTSCTWFVCRQSSTFFHFLIPFGSYTATSFVDQNASAFNGLVSTNSTGSSYYGQISFMHYAGHTQRTYLGAASLYNSTSVTLYRYSHFLARYSAFGNVSAGGTSNVIESQPITWLPVAMANTNTALAADHTPVYTSILCSPYLPVLPADFAMTAYYASTAITTGDTLVVTASSEEYEVVTTAGGTVSTAGSATTALLARTV
jgi:hypothetical protein